jgi:hypothetical protein
LGSLLEKHEDEYDEWKSFKLTETFMVVPRNAIEWEGNLLDESAGKVNERAYEGKLKRHLYECTPLGF